MALDDLLIVRLGQDITPNLEFALPLLTGRGHAIRELPVPDSGLPRRAGRSAKRTSHLFSHTPEPLVDSWRTAQHLKRRSEPGDTVVIPDRGGVGGVAALEESTKPAHQRRVIWTVAGDGLYLQQMLVGGTALGVDEAGRSAIDWELVQYRASDRVLATSETAMALLDELGVRAELVSAPQDPPGRSLEKVGNGVWAPGTVSRQNRSGDVMRAVASVPDLDLTVSTTDAADEIWSGTTWDALAGVRGVLGARLQRSDSPSEPPACVVVADALRPPGGATIAWRSVGVTVFVPDGSVAAGMWPEAPRWRSMDELAGLLRGAVKSPSPSVIAPPAGSVAGVSNHPRARRVSVGVPVFGGVEYLDECIDSVLAQSMPPTEILLIDDGSASPGVTAALETWARRLPDLVRVMHQSNRGVCVARNHMIKEMTGDAFLLVDQDDVLYPTFIERTAEALRQDDSLWAAAVWTEFFGEYEGIEAKPPFDRRTALVENPIVSTAALVDIRVRDAGVAFAPDLAFLYCEDWHYWSQIVAVGGRIGLVPEPLIRHRVHHASGGFQRTEVAHRIGRARATEPLIRMPDARR